VEEPEAGETEDTADDPEPDRKTGDHNNLSLWIVLLGVSGTALAASLIGRRRRSERKER